MQPPCSWKIALLFLVTSTSGFISAAFSADAAIRFKQKHFAIGACWFKLPDDDKADAFYADVAAAHFNVAMGPHGSINTIESAVKQLRLCEKHKINLFYFQKLLKIKNPEMLKMGSCCSF